MLLILVYFFFMSCVAGNVRTSTHLADFSKPQSGEHIPLEFFISATEAGQSKINLQKQLDNFLESLHRNLTTSPILNTLIETAHDNYTRKQMEKLSSLSKFFEETAEAAMDFAMKSYQFFEITKSTSNTFLLKLRQVPMPQPMEVKSLLTNYFTEMEFFHIMFSEIVDEALEYTQDSLRSMHKTFIHFVEIQNEVLRDWNFKADEYCCARYMDFLQNWSAQFFSCAAGHQLDISYDVYAMTEVTVKYIMRQIEFRIQRLFNCFLFLHNNIRCRFLYYPERDFEKLFAKLEELEMYLDIKTKRGRVSINRNQQRRRRQQTEVTSESIENQDKCIPHGFPIAKMSVNLISCFSMDL